MLRKIILGLCITVFTATCYGAGTGDIEWGVPANSIQNIIYIGCDLNATFYQPAKLPENIKIGNIVLLPRNMQYIFWDNKLGRIYISLDLVSKNRIYEELTKSYGQPDIKNYPEVKKYIWRKPPTIIILNISSSECSIEYMSYDIFMKQIKLEGNDSIDTLW